MPGQTDGYGLNTDFVYNLQYYKDEVDTFMRKEEETDRRRRRRSAEAEEEELERSRRAGPYPLTKEQAYVIYVYMDIVRVEEDVLRQGIGQMWLFDLQGKHAITPCYRPLL